MMNYIFFRTVGQLFVWVILLASCLSGSAKGETAQSLFQKALTAEKSRGDHRVASQLYRQIIDRYGKTDIAIVKRAQERIASLGGEPTVRDQVQIGGAVEMQKQSISAPLRNLPGNSSFGFSRARILKRQQVIAQSRLRPEKFVGLYSNSILSRMAGSGIRTQKVYTRDSYLFWAGTLQQALGLNRMTERIVFFSIRRRKAQTLSSSDLYVAGLIAEKDGLDKSAAADFYRKALNSAPEILAKHIRLKLEILGEK